MIICEAWHFTNAMNIIQVCYMHMFVLAHNSCRDDTGLDLCMAISWLLHYDLSTCGNGVCAPMVTVIYTLDGTMCKYPFAHTLALANVQRTEYSKHKWIQCKRDFIDASRKVLNLFISTQFINFIAVDNHVV